MNKEKYEKIQMEVVELKEDIIMASCNPHSICNTVGCGWETAPCDSESCTSVTLPCSSNCSKFGIGNSTIISSGGGGIPVICTLENNLCLGDNTGIGCSSFSCSEESISPANP